MDFIQQFQKGECMINIRDLNYEELEKILIEMGEKKYRAKQIFSWLYKGIDSFDEMTDISKELIEKFGDVEKGEEHRKTIGEGFYLTEEAAQRFVYSNC